MTRILRTSALGLTVLVAGAGLLLMAACGGSTGNAATQVSSPIASSVAVHQATPAPAAVTTAPTAAPTAAPVAATAAPVTPAPATPAPTPTDAPPPAPVDVTVTLAEFKVESSLAVFHVGVPYHFIITNNGKIAHELNIANLDARPVAPGATVTLDLTFPSPIQAEFACHLPSHYEAGMKLPVTIEA